MQNAVNTTDGVQHDLSAQNNSATNSNNAEERNIQGGEATVESGAQPPGAAPDNCNGPDEDGGVVTRLRALLGPDAVLLPVPHGTKRPIFDGWQNTTVADMDAAYLTRLQGGNIGILLGEASGDLCAIDIDDDGLVEPFLTLNPLLRTTLRSKGARGVQIWVRLNGLYPKLTKIKNAEGGDWGEWRADGGQSIIHGTHPDGMEYRILNEVPPISIDFEEIQWPGNLNLPWVKTEFDELVEQHGAPFKVGEKGGVTLNHMFFVRKYMAEHQVFFDSGLGDFFEYEAATGLWKKTTPESIKRQLLDDLGETARRTGCGEIFLKRTDGLAVSMLALLKAITEKKDGFSERKPAIHVTNGMIVFEGDDVVLKSFHPSYLSRNMCPFAYDPAAECPRFKSELLEPALNAEDIRLTKKWAGAVLLGKNSAQRFLMLLGTPNGGKSTLMTILEKVIGVQNVSQLRTEHLADRFELYGYGGKTLLTGKDVSAQFLMHKGAHVLKALVGGDLLEGEKKGFNERIQLRGDFNVGITCNADLNIRLEGDAGAWRRRMLVIKYERSAPEKRIPDFADILLAEEGPGILRWMVEGAMELLEDLREVGDYKLTFKQQHRIGQIMDQSDSVRKFVENRVVASTGDDVAGNELLAAYYDYCETNGWHPHAGSEIAVQLPRLMLEVHKTGKRNDITRDGKAVRGYKNVRVEEVH